MAFDKIRIIYPQVIYLITDVLLLEILGLESVHGRFLTLFFFYLGFLSQTFTNHRTAGEGGGHFTTTYTRFTDT